MDDLRTKGLFLAILVWLINYGFVTLVLLYYHLHLHAGHCPSIPTRTISE